MKKSTFKKLQIASLAAGLALFVYLVYQTGISTLAQYMGMMGWGAGVILALSAVRNCARAGSWYFSIEPEHRRLGFWTILNVMLAGEAIKYLTATGPFLSEPAKAAIVRRQVPLLYGVSSVVVENLVYYLSVLMLMLAGMPALAWLPQVHDGLKTAGYIVAAVIILSLAGGGLAMRRRWYVLSSLLERLGRRAANRRERFEAIASRTRSLEENVYSFYERRRGVFYFILALNLSAHLINVVEVYVLLALMRLPASIQAGFVIEAVTKIINMAFFFVPARAGVYESGNALVLGALGMGAGAGVALAIIRKLRAFVWAGYGLVVIAFITMRDKGAGRGHADATSGEESAAE
ncbi:MAG: flippase-like domain-containing protein [Blastocatellia bacterium]|nr:flippase-like domain-containing protein [Blastocatellia bacterium]